MEKKRETGLSVLCSERANVDSYSRIRSGVYAWDSHARKVPHTQKREGGQKSGPAGRQVERQEVGKEYMPPPRSEIDLFQG